MSRGQTAKYRLSRLKNNAQLADSFFAPFCLSETRVLLLALVEGSGLVACPACLRKWAHRDWDSVNQLGLGLSSTPEILLATSIYSIGYV